MAAVPTSDGAAPADIKALFDVMDLDGNGCITREELMQLRQQTSHGSGLGDDEEDLSALLMAADVNGDGVIDFDEFCQIYNAPAPAPSDAPEEEQDGKGAPSPALEEDARLREIFERLDVDADGYVDAQELMDLEKTMFAAHGNEYDAEARRDALQAFFSSADENGDQRLDFGEFKRAMNLLGGMGLEQQQRPSPPSSPSSSSSSSSSAASSPSHTAPHPSSMVFATVDDYDDDNRGQRDDTDIREMSAQLSQLQREASEPDVARPTTHLHVQKPSLSRPVTISHHQVRVVAAADSTEKHWKSKTALALRVGNEFKLRYLKAAQELEAVRSQLREAEERAQRVPALEQAESREKHRADHYQRMHAELRDEVEAAEAAAAKAQAAHARELERVRAEARARESKLEQARADEAAKSADLAARTQQLERKAQAARGIARELEAKMRTARRAAAADVARLEAAAEAQRKEAEADKTRALEAVKREFERERNELLAERDAAVERAAAVREELVSTAEALEASQAHKHELQRQLREKDLELAAATSPSRSRSSTQDDISDRHQSLIEELFGLGADSDDSQERPQQQNNRTKEFFVLTFFAVKQRLEVRYQNMQRNGVAGARRPLQLKPLDLYEAAQRLDPPLPFYWFGKWIESKLLPPETPAQSLASPTTAAALAEHKT